MLHKAVYKRIPTTWEYHGLMIALARNGQSWSAVDFDLCIGSLANDPGDQGSIPGWVIPKTQKVVLNAALLNTQHYKIWIKGKVE